MANALIQLAVDKIWCNPTQDNQIIFQLARLTGYNGSINSFKMLMTSFNLPVKRQRFHLFQIGQIHPTTVNFFQESLNWVKLSTACTASEVGVHLYTADGISLSLDQAYYLKTEEKNLIIAIRELPNTGVSPTGVKHIEYGSTPVFLQLYKNAFYSSSRSQVIPDDVYIESLVNATSNEIIAMQNSYNLYNVKQGYTLAFKNGYVIPNISLVQCQVGDNCEFIYDSSVKRVVDFSVKDLIRFDSTLDSMGKYILHHGAGDANAIEYIDDIDMYIMNSTTGVGVVYHRNEKSALRMLTHRDYSTSVDKVMAFINEHSDIMSFDNAKLRLVIRHSGYDRALVKEASRIHELYKLGSAQILQAMYGLNATVDAWRAESLERSAYVKIMSQRAADITSQDVAQAYGFNALMTEIAPVFKTTVLNGSIKQTEVPNHYTSGCTVFEYNSAGILLGSYAHTGSTTYTTTNTQCEKVEYILGTGSRYMDDTYNTLTQTLDPKYDYRFYIKYKFGDVHVNKWSDVTDQYEKYQVEGNTIHWLVSDNYYTLVRSNKNFYLAQKTFPLTDGLMVANVTSFRSLNGVQTELEMEIPPGEFDLFLNGHPIIEGLDYHVDFPTISVCNKAYINQALPLQVLTIRAKGLCMRNFERTDTNEFGYVINGRVSVDKQYDVRDDKPTSLIVGGSLILASDVTYNEDSSGFTLSHTLNGKPYLIKDCITPLKSISGIDTYEMKAAASQTDAQVSNYLTSKLTSPVATLVNPIANKHVLYSPFISKIMHDLLTGVLSEDGLDQNYNDMWVMDKLKNHTYLLSLDPIHNDNRPNAEFCSIDPHCWAGVVSLKPMVYRFIDRVISIYAKQVVSLSGHAMITTA